MADSDLLSAVQEIRDHLARMDRRDRLRTVGGFFRSLLGLIPLFFVIYGAWYLYAHGQDVIGMIAEEAAKKASEATQGQFENFDINSLFNQGQSSSVN